MKTFKLLFRSLFSNQACIEGGRHKKWWYALIYFLLAIILAILPTFVSGMQVNGSNFIPANTFNFDTSLVEFSNFVADNETSIVIKNNTIEVLHWVGDNDTSWKHSFERVINGESKTFVDFEVFYLNESGTTFENKVKNILANRKPSEYESTTEGAILKTTEESSEPETNYNLPGQHGYRDTSFMVFGNEKVYVFLYKPNTAKYTASFVGDYKNISLDIGSLAYVDFTAKELRAAGLSVINEDSITLSQKDIIEDSNYVPLQNKYIEKSFLNWKEFYNLSYTSTKDKTTLVTTLVTLAVYALLGLFMGLIVFFITRGKNNPYRYFKFFESLRIGCWTMLTPALLTMIVGFIFPNYALIAFVLLIGLRTMWMSMKSLKPQAAPINQRGKTGNSK